MTSGGTLVHKRKSLKDKERAKRGRGDSSKFNLLEHISLDRYLIEAFHLFIGVVSANTRASGGSKAKFAQGEEKINGRN